MDNVCYTCIFSNYEELKEPTVITPGWRYICYTDQPLTSKVWTIVPMQIPVWATPQLFARYFKIMEFVDWERSFWIDASFVIDTDLNEWWDKYFAKGISAPAHPWRDCVYEECMDCIISNRGNRVQIDAQMNEYKALGIPQHNGIISSGLLMRENTPAVIAFCERWWKELSSHSVRDQIAFARVSWELATLDVVNTYRFDYRQEKEFIYKHHYNRR